MHRAYVTYASRESEDSDAIVARYASLVDREARRIVARTGLTSAFDDLWSAGALGLLEAKRRFEPDKGASFETFAAHRIRGAMIDELRRLDHLPRRLRSRTDEVAKTKAKLSQSLGREATVEELASELDVDLEEVSGLSALTEAHVPLESIIGTLHTESTVDDELDRGRIVKMLARAIEQLPERLQILVALHYQEGLSYREISKILDVSEPRVCQLHGDAMKRLRLSLESADPMDRGG